MQEYCISDRAKRQKLEEIKEKRKSRNSERSHQKPWHSDQSKQHKTVNSVSEEESRESRHHKSKSGRDHREDRPSREDRFTREDRSSRDDRSSREDRYNREDRYHKALREKGAKEKKRHFAISMAKIKVIGPMNAQLQLKRRQSSTAKTPSQPNQSITPRNHRNKFPFHPLPGPQHQIGQYLTQSTTTTRHTHLQCHYLRINPCHHLRTSQCRCYPPRSTPTRGQGAPRLCHHHQSLSQDRSRKEQPMPPPAVWSTSSMPSPGGPMNQCTKRRDSTKNISEQCLM